MLTENDIIDRVSEYLEQHGYNIKQRLGTSEKGIDIIAQKNEQTLYIEAKGETSASEGTHRFGKPFSKNQVKTHVAMAILASMRALASKPHDFTQVAIALPDNEYHRALIASIKSVLKKIEIDVYLVGYHSVVKI